MREPSPAPRAVRGEDRRGSMTTTIGIKPGVPTSGGQYIFLLWDGTLVSAVLHRESGQRVITFYNLAEPKCPQKITFPADTGKIVGYAEVTDRGRVA